MFSGSFGGWLDLGLDWTECLGMSVFPIGTVEEEGNLNQKKQQSSNAEAINAFTFRCKR